MITLATVRTYRRLLASRLADTTEFSSLRPNLNPRINPKLTQKKISAAPAGKKTRL